MLAVVFPGQGSQAVGMSTDFAAAHPAAREVFEEADEAFGGPLSKLIAEGPESELQRTEITQPAIVTASIAAWRVVEPQLGGPPAFFAGHSLGEYSALVAAGGLTLGDAVRLVRRRGAFMQEAVPQGQGEMAAVMGLTNEEVARTCASIDGVVAPANLNSPSQTVIAGAADAVQAAIAKLKQAGAKRVVPLAVSAPFHSALMRPAMLKLSAELASCPFAEQRVPVVSNVDAAPYTSPDVARERLREQVCAPVRWVELVRTMRSAGVSVQLEVGPGKVLSGLAARIDRGLARASVATTDEVAPALAAVAEALS